MNIGKMDRRITLQLPGKVVSTSGQEKLAWPPEGGTEVATVWAQKQEESGRERIRNGRLEERQAVIWTIRYRDVTGTMRIVENGEVYEVTGDPREIGRRQFLEITTVKVS